MDRATREALAEKRLVSVIGRHGAATARTLEMKISDAGPLNQRLDPHVFGPVRKRLEQEGQILRITRHGRDWFALRDTPPVIVERRITEQFETLRPTLDGAFNIRLGDTLEIAVHRALRDAQKLGLHSIGGFRGLADAPTTSKIPKEQPPAIFGGRELQGNKRFDFLVGTATWAGIECKNVREWLYPDRPEIRDMLGKAIDLDIPPILIARRIPYVTRRLLQPAGVLLWETLNQLYPPEAANLAAQLRHKDSLGFFDIRATDSPSTTLHDFVCRIIPAELAGARTRFDQFKDLLDEFARGRMRYKEFAARIRRREGSKNEDWDLEEEGSPPF